MSYARCAVALFAAAGLLVLPAPVGASGSFSPPLRRAPRCETIQLLVRPYRAANLAAGGPTQRVIVYRVHDLWNSPCHLNGYPGVEFLNGQFQTPFPTHIPWVTNVSAQPALV